MLTLLALFALVFQVQLAIADAGGLFDASKCGQTRGCWSFPRDCKGTKCQGLIRWLNNGERLTIEMQGKDLANFENGRYVALGFSTDAGMGDDTVVECVFDADGTGAAFISHNGPSSNNQLLDATKKMITKSSTFLKDGQMVCTVEVDFGKLKIVDEHERKQIHELNDKAWILQFARGITEPDTGEKVIHSLGDDELYPWTTGDEVKLCKDCDQKFQVVEKMQQF